MSASAPRHSHTPRARAGRENPEGNYNRDRPQPGARQQCRVWSVTTINYTGKQQKKSKAAQNVIFHINACIKIKQDKVFLTLSVLQSVLKMMREIS